MANKTEIVGKTVDIAACRTLRSALRGDLLRATILPTCSIAESPPVASDPGRPLESGQCLGATSRSIISRSRWEP